MPNANCFNLLDEHILLCLLDWYIYCFHRLYVYSNEEEYPYQLEKKAGLVMQLLRQ